MSYYFRYLPNLEYISRSSDEELISNYTETKNLFKRGKIREDIFQNLAFFTKYDIIGDERPDNVAYKMYGDERLDWIVLLSNNIVNIYDEWPLTQEAFDKYLLEKYGSYGEIYKIHHYKTKELKNASGNIILKSDLIFSPKITLTGPTWPDFQLNYYDSLLQDQTYVPNIDIFDPVTNYEYEDEIQNKKRNIFLIKSSYVPVVINDMEKIMPYKEGGEQYVNPALKRVDNIRLYGN
jgi:uncharacterized phage-like protein YoqJ